MSTAELDILRKELSQWINTISDSSLLQTLNAIKSSSNQSADWWEEISSAERMKIDLGMNDLNDDKTISSKDFWRQLG